MLSRDAALLTYRTLSTSKPGVTFRHVILEKTRSENPGSSQIEQMRREATEKWLAWEDLARTGYFFVRHLQLSVCSTLSLQAGKRERVQ